ncbi:hypothetical protein J4440_06355 [Candidatus Woesearchaeota archaeon]|nr:hypothetical protein [Candidatus Woesearchaeota archaeon]
MLLTKLIQTGILTFGLVVSSDVDSKELNINDKLRTLWNYVLNNSDIACDEFQRNCERNVQPNKKFVVYRKNVLFDGETITLQINDANDRPYGDYRPTLNSDMKFNGDDSISLYKNNNDRFSCIFGTPVGTHLSADQKECLSIFEKLYDVVIKPENTKK